MPAILRGGREDMGEGWNGQARGKINTFPSDADGLGEVSILAWALNLERDNCVRALMNVYWRNF